MFLKYTLLLLGTVFVSCVTFCMQDNQERLNKQLLRAAKKGNVTLVTRLLNGRIRLDLEAEYETCTEGDPEENNGSTPLQLAARYGHLEVVKYLTTKGANINSEDASNNFSPLFLASREGHLKVVEYLVQTGANLESSEKGGCTPLHAAADEDHLEIVKFLVCHGANMYATLDGESVLDRACGKSSEYLEQVEKLFEAVGKNKPKQIKKLIQNGADIEAKDSNGDTPLHKAASKDLCRCVAVLLSSIKCDSVARARKLLLLLEMRNKNGKTPFDLAAKFEKTTKCLNDIKKNAENIRSFLYGSILLKNKWFADVLFV